MKADTHVVIDTVSTHHCNWPGCTQQVPDRWWGCIEHWHLLPLHLRKLWRLEYRQGEPTLRLRQVMLWIQEWIAQRKG